MDEIMNATEEFEFDEATLRKIARKYTLTTIIAVITVTAALVTIIASYSYFTGNLEIAGAVQRGITCVEEENYTPAISEFDNAEKTVNAKNGIIPVYRTGNKSFWKKIELYEKVYGPLECRALLKSYYPDEKYPQKAREYLDRANIFVKGYNELQTVVYRTSNNYAQAYEEIERIAQENSDYPEYLILYFHLLATQRFEERAASQIAVYNELERNAPEATWLYASAGTKALIKNNELNKALRLCPDNADEETNAMHIKIYRLMGEYKSAGMLYDEYRSYDVPSELLDREKLIIGLLEGNAKKALKACSYYTKNLDNCKTADMVYTLLIAAIKANDKKLEKKISEYAEKKGIPASAEVQGYKLDELTLDDLFLNGESDLS